MLFIFLYYSKIILSPPLFEFVEIVFLNFMLKMWSTKRLGGGLGSWLWWGVGGCCAIFHHIPHLLFSHIRHIASL